MVINVTQNHHTMHCPASMTRKNRNALFTCEEVGELDGEDDSFLERLLCGIQSCDIRPLDVGLLGQNRRCQRALQLFCIRIILVIIIAVLLPARSSIEESVSAA